MGNNNCARPIKHLTFFNMPIERSPPDDLFNKNDKRQKMSSTCMVCKKKASSEVLECVICKGYFEPKCVFLSNEQLSFFTSNKIPWSCPSCFYTQSESTNNAIAKLSSAVSELKSGLTTCIQSVDGISTSISHFQQEMNARIKTLVSNLDDIALRVTTLENDVLSNSLILSGYKIVSTNKFNHKQALIKIFASVNLNVLSGDFHFNYIPSSNSIKITFTDIKFVCQLQTTLIEWSRDKSKSMLFSNIDGLINSHHIKITFNSKSNEASSRMDRVEQRETARDIKIYGIPIQFNKDNPEAPESRYALKTIVLQICKKFVPTITSRDFTQRRISKTQNVIVSFFDNDLRDEIYYQYLSFVSRNRASVSNDKTVQSTVKSPGGIEANIFGLSFSSRILFSEHLISTVRDQYAYARNLKQNGVIFAFSTRKGRLVIKIDKNDQWKIINNVNEMFYLQP